MPDPATQRRRSPARRNRFATKLEQKKAVRAACLAEYEHLNGQPFRAAARLPPLTEEDPKRKAHDPVEHEAREAFKALRAAFRRGVKVMRAYAVEAKKVDPPSAPTGLLLGVPRTGGRTRDWPAAKWWVDWLAGALHAPESSELFADVLRFKPLERKSERSRIISTCVFFTARALERERGREPTRAELTKALSARCVALETLLLGCWPTKVPSDASVAKVIAAEIRGVRRPLREEIDRYG